MPTPDEVDADLENLREYAKAFGNSLYGKGTNDVLRDVEAAYVVVKDELEKLRKEKHVLPNDPQR